MDKIDDMSHTYALGDPYVVSVEEMDGTFPLFTYGKT